MASGGYRPAMGVEQHLATSVATNGVPGQKTELPAAPTSHRLRDSLGPNPYVRMIKCSFGEKLCKVSNVPMQSFRWKGRAARAVQGDDRLSRSRRREEHLPGVLVGHDVWRACGCEDALLRAGGAPNTAATPKLCRTRIRPTTTGKGERKRSRRGVRERTAHGAFQGVIIVSKTNRIRECEGRHGLSEICRRSVRSGWPGPVQGSQGYLSIPTLLWAVLFPEPARNHRDECAALVEDLKANGPGKGHGDCPVEVRQMIKDALGGNKEEAIRNRASGRDTDTQVYINRVKSRRRSKSLPINPYVHCGSARRRGITEADLVDAFYSYGELKAVRLANNCAFVEFADRESAERAADAKYRNLVIKGNSLPLDWARPRGGPSQKRDADEVGLPGVLPGQQAPALRPELPRPLVWSPTGPGGASPTKEGAAAAARAVPVHGPEPARVAAARAPPARPRRGCGLELRVSPAATARLPWMNQKPYSGRSGACRAAGPPPR